MPIAFTTLGTVYKRFAVKLFYDDIGMEFGEE